MKDKAFIDLQHLGLEVENDAVNLNILKEIQGFRHVHDASTVQSLPFLNGVPVLDENNILKGLRSQKLGTEVVSINPLELTKKTEKSIQKLCSSFYKANATPTSDRSGIHIHVSLQPNLNYIKEIIKLTLHYEDLLFTLAGLGGTFRGESNDSIYCRPFSKDGPPYCKTVNGYGPILNINDLLNTKTLAGFKVKYGDIYDNGVRGYPIARYAIVNFVTLFRQGSLEFRAWNTTLNAKYIFSAMWFCREFTKLAVRRVLNEEKYNYKINSIFTPRDKGELITSLEEFLREVFIPDEYSEILLDMLMKSEIPKIKNEKVFTHLMFHRNGDRTRTHFQGDYCTKSQKRKTGIKEPIFIDAHVLAEKRRKKLKEKQEKELERLLLNKKMVRKKRNIEDRNRKQINVFFPGEL